MSHHNPRSQFQSRVAAILASLLFVFSVGASEQTDSIKAEIQKKVPNREVVSVNETAVPGWFEVVWTPHQIAYTDANANFLMTGELLDLNQHINITRERVKALNRTDFTKLPFEHAIKVVKGNGMRKVAVFADPDCPYCKRFEQETLNKTDNITIYTFLLPIPSLHPDSIRKSGILWCATDKAKAWQTWMYFGQLPQNSGECDTPIEANHELAKRLGIAPTPTLVFESGEIVTGGLILEAFESHLAESAPH